MIFDHTPIGYINAAIKMLNDTRMNVAAHNGIVSLLTEAKILLNSDQKVQASVATESKSGLNSPAHNSVDLLPVQVESAEELIKLQTKFFQDCTEWVKENGVHQFTVISKEPSQMWNWIENNILIANQFKPDTEAIDPKK